MSPRFFPALILVHAFLLLTLSSVAAQRGGGGDSDGADEVREVRRVAEAWVAAVTAEDIEQVMRYTPEWTFTEQERIRDLALHLDSAGLRMMPYSDQIGVLVLRGHLSLAELQEFDGQALFRRGSTIGRGLIDKNIRIEFLRFDVDGDSATAVIRVNWELMPFPLEFVRENGEWKVDASIFVAIIEPAFRGARARSPVDLDRAIEVMLTMTGITRDPVELWHPPLPDSAAMRQLRFDLQVTDDMAAALRHVYATLDINALRAWRSDLTFRRIHGHEQVDVVPVIFFDPGSSTLSPGRYRMLANRQQADRYRASDPVSFYSPKKGAIIEQQREVLDVIGKTLQLNPDYRLSFEGSYSAEARESTALAKDRIERVQSYLTSIWGISPDRFGTVTVRRYAEETDHGRAQQESRAVRLFLEHPFGFGYDNTIGIYTKTTQVPGFEFVPLKIGAVLPIDRRIVSTEIVAWSGDDTLSRSPLPEREGMVVRDLIAISVIPRDLRVVDSPIRYRLESVDSEGEVIRSNVIEIPWSIVDSGSHPEFDDEVNFNGSQEFALADFADFDPDREAFKQWLGGRKETYLISETFTGFSFRDTLLSPLHQLQIASLEERIRARIEDDPDRRWRMRVVGTATADEAFDIDVDAVDRLYAFLEEIAKSARGEDVESPFRVNFYFPETDTAQIGRNIWAFGPRSIDVIMGERGGGPTQFGTVRLDLNAKPYPFAPIGTLPVQADPSGIETARARSVGRLIAQQWDFLSFDSIAARAHHPTGTLRPVTTNVAEHDYVTRSVRITIYDDRSRAWFDEEREKEEKGGR